MNSVLEKYKEVAHRYVKAMESLREARRELAEIIIKYLIANSAELSKCTELAISKNLGLPRSIVRSILSELVDKHILEVKGMGNVKPYTFTKVGIGAALDWMDLSFTREEINELLRAKETEKLTGCICASPLVSKKVNDKPVARYRGCDADLCLDTLVKRFLECVGNDSKKMSEKIKTAFGEDVLRELELLLPELKAFEKLIYDLWIPGIPFGLEWAFRGIIGKLDRLPVEDIKRAVVSEYEKALKSILNRLKKFASLLEELGYEGLHKHFEGKKYVYYKLEGVEEGKPKFRFHDAYLWATTLALREGCVVGEKLGVDPNLINEARSLADALDLALERKYRGVKVEGLRLIEWYKSLSSEKVT